MLTPEPAIDDLILEAIKGGAVIAFSLSGGKDSTAATHGAMALLDRLGHPREDRIAIHADLGRAEWKSTPEMVERVAAHFSLPLVVVRRNAGDMVARWEQRFAEGKRRYAALEVFNLIGPWSGASLRFCTAELKQQVISPALTRMFPGRTIISVVGVRRDESVGRKNTPISKPEPRWDKRDGSRVLTWNPGVLWSTPSIYERHRVHGLPLHEAYTVYNSSRVSCAFCIMQSRGDQLASVTAPSNHDLYRHLVAMEAESTFSFQPANWLGDVAPHLLPESLQADLAKGKLRAAFRRELEAALPAGLRYVKGWPPREPTYDEAFNIGYARREILEQHGLPISFPTPLSIIGRFRQLMDEQARKAAA